VSDIHERMLGTRMLSAVPSPEPVLVLHVQSNS